MSGRNNENQTILDQPLHIQYISSLPHLTQILSQAKPLPKSYHFWLILDESIPSYRDILAHFRKLMLRQALPCYHVFYYYNDVSSLLKYIEKEQQDMPKEERVLRQFQDVMGGHALIVREQMENGSGTKDRLIEVQSKEGLERAMGRLKYVRFANEDEEEER